MTYKFKEFEEKIIRPDSDPKVTIMKTGTINFNKAFVDKYWEDIVPANVVFHYDEEAKVIGLEISLDHKPNSYPLRKSKDGKYCMVSARAFLKHFNILDEKKSRSFRIEKDDENKGDKDYFFTISLKEGE